MNEEQSRFRILSAVFETSVVEPQGMPEILLPEVAVVGRSNVGKSSLINALCGQKSLAKTSKTPGRTAALNYFQICFQQDTKQEKTRYDAYLVDLPGYGYAAVSKKEQARWGELLEFYFYEYQQYRAILLLLDSRRDPREDEMWFTELDSDYRLIAAMTKCDKLSKNEVSKQRKVYASALGLPTASVIPCSVLKGKQQGIREVTQAVCSALL